MVVLLTMRCLRHHIGPLVSIRGAQNGLRCPLAARHWHVYDTINSSPREIRREPLPLSQHRHMHLRSAICPHVFRNVHLVVLKVRPDLWRQLIWEGPWRAFL